MQVIKLESLDVGEELPFNLYNREGIVLLAKGARLTQMHLDILHNREIEELYIDEEESSLLQKLLAVEVRDIPLNKPLSYSIYYRNGLILLPKGTIFSTKHHEILKKGDIFAVYKLINEPKNPAAPAAPIDRLSSLDNKVDQDFVEGRSFDDELATRQERPYLEEVEPEISPGNQNRTVFNKMTQQYKALNDVTEELFEDITQEKGIDFKRTTSYVESVLKTYIKHSSLLVSMKDFVIKQNYLFTHSTNVFLMSVFVGVQLGLTRKQLMDLATAALLHDIGMMKVPQEIIAKKGPLTLNEWFEVKKHPIHGVNLLEKIPGMNDRILLIVYQHHERRNGSGYPKKRPDFMIHPYSKLVGIADSYDAMSSDRVFRNRRIRYRAMEELLLEAKRLYEPRIVRKFLETFSLFPLGSVVRLNSTELARVLRSNAQDYSRPIVRIVKDSSGKKPEEGEIIDLATRPDLTIVSVLDRGELRLEGIEEFGF